MVAADVILSIFQDRFSTIHYDYFVGGNGSGKSSLADTFAAVGYRVVIMTDPTAPNIFRLLGVVEPAQCTMILEEAEKIDKSQELMAMLKTGSSRNGRVPRINTNTLKQEFFFSYCLKIIVSERSLSQFIAKGVITRIIPINLFKGSIKHDIKEVLNPTDTGGSENKELLAELEDFKKLLLVYRLMHFKDPIQELDVGVEGRDKELVKHLVQLFYGCKCLSQIIQSLQKFLDIKSDKKDTTIESILIKSVLDLLDRLGKERKEEIASISIWNEFTGNIQGVPDEKNPNNYYSNEYGTLYRTKISSYLSDSLGGKVKHSNRGNVWTFNKKELKKLSRKDPTKIKITIGMRKRATKSEGVNTVNTNTGEPPQNIDKNKETEQLESPTYTGFTLSQSSNAPIYIKKEGL